MYKQKRVWQKVIETAVKNYDGNLDTSLRDAKEILDCGDEPLSDAYAILELAASKLKDTKIHASSMYDIETKLPEKLDNLIDMALSYDKKTKEFSEKY